MNRFVKFKSKISRFMNEQYNEQLFEYANAMKNVDKCHARYRRENPVENIIEKIDQKKSNGSSTYIPRSIIQQSIVKSR